MAIAKQCDICKRFYKAYNTEVDAEHVSGLIFTNVDEGGRFRYEEGAAIELCPSCMKRFVGLYRKMKREVEEK